MQLPRILTSQPSSQGQRGEETHSVLKCPGPSRPLAPHPLLLEVWLPRLCRTLCLWQAGCTLVSSSEPPPCPAAQPSSWFSQSPPPHHLSLNLHSENSPSLSPALLVAQLVKNSIAMQVRFLGQEDPLEKG